MMLYQVLVLYRVSDYYPVSHREVLYCGYNRQEAAQAYFASKPLDKYREPSDSSRQTVCRKKLIHEEAVPSAG